MNRMSPFFASAAKKRRSRQSQAIENPGPHHHCFSAQHVIRSPTRNNRAFAKNICIGTVPKPPW